MSSLGTVGIGMSKIPADAINEKGYVNIDFSIDDKTDAYGQNVAFFIRQSQEEREAKLPRVYVGNGKIVWTKDGVITVADKVERQVTNSDFNAARAEAPVTEDTKTSDLPF